jgi:hypothetical protein
MADAIKKFTEKKSKKSEVRTEVKESKGKEKKPTLRSFSRPVVVKKEESKGQAFKKKIGYSKSMKRLMTKYDVQTLEEYRVIRKKTKSEERKMQKEKHSSALAGRKAGKSTANKQIKAPKVAA